MSEQPIKCAWTYQCTPRAPQQHLYRVFFVSALLSFWTILFPRYSRGLISKQNVWFLLGFCWGLTIKQLTHSCFYCVHSFQQMCIASRFEILLVMYLYIAAFFLSFVQNKFWHSWPVQNMEGALGVAEPVLFCFSVSENMWLPKKLGCNGEKKLTTMEICNAYCSLCTDMKFLAIWQ